MDEMKLVCIKGEDKGKEFILSEKVITFGRSGESDIILKDYKASRKHAKIIKEGSKLVIQDGKSLNGTFVNGERIKKKVLNNRDEIMMGETLFTIEIPQKFASISQEDSSHTIVRPIAELNKEVTSDFQEEKAENILDEKKKIDDKQVDVSDEEETVSVDKNLHLVHRVGKLLSGTYKMGELMEKIVNIIYEILGVERVVLFLKENGNFAPKVACTRSGIEKSGLEIRVSSTILRQSTSEKAGIITGDAGSDERFGGSESIVLQQIHSAMCVPLLSGNEVNGAVYVDSSSRIGLFTETELKTFACIASEASVAIENYKLIDQIKDETLKRERFQRYLSPGVAEQIVQGQKDIELGGVRREITVLFADIRDFTALSEKMPPGEIVNILNELFTFLTDAVFKYGGTLDKFIGDALMAVFGAPVEYDDHALRAVKCAIEMQGEIKKFNQKRKDAGKENIQVGIGINTGECIIGNMGSLKRMDYTAIGDTVNTSSRIVSLCPGNAVYINETTNSQIEFKIKTEKIKPVKVKGKIKLLNLFSVRINGKSPAGKM